MLQGILTIQSGFGVRGENALMHFSHCRLRGSFDCGVVRMANDASAQDDSL